MALPTFINAGNVNQAFATQLESQRYMADSFSKLGGQIASSIAVNRAQDEAAKAAPILQQQMAQAYQQIANGNQAGGLSELVGLGAQTSNPFLQQATQNALKAGLFISQQQYSTARNDADNQSMMDRSQYLATQRQTAPPKPLSGAGLADAQSKFSKDMSSAMNEISLAGTEEEYNRAVENAQQIHSVYSEAGLPVQEFSPPPFLAKDKKAKIKALQEEIDEAEKPRMFNSTYMGMGTPYKDIISQKQAEIDKIKKSAKSPAMRTSSQDFSAYEGRVLEKNGKKYRIVNGQPQPL